MPIALDQITTWIAEPIPGGDPCGEDPKYDPLYEGIREEIAKTSGIGHGACDWEKVVKDSQTLLKNTSKEINLAAYLCCGLAQAEGIPGMIAGLEGLSVFLKTFWENMFPPLKKIQIRERSLSWVNDRLLELKDEGKLESKDRSELEKVLEVLDAFKEVVYEKFPEPPTNFKGLRNYFEETLNYLPPEPEPEPEKPPEPPPTAEQPKPATTAPASSQPASKPTGPAPGTPFEMPAMGDDASIEEMVKVLGKIGEAISKADPQNPLGFQLRRQGAWYYTKLPNNNDGETFLMPPADELQTALKNMFSKAAWANLLERAEDLMNRFPLWLDLQFYCGTAASILGESHEKVLRAIMQETYLLDQRIPQLKTLKFNDGTPFASSQTRDWIEGLAGQLAGGGGSAKDAAADLRSELMQTGVDRYAEALEMAQKVIETAQNPRDAFRMRFEAAAFCFEAKQFHWCHAFLEGLGSTIKKMRLQDWEPQLCGRVWGLHIKVARDLREEGPQWATVEQEAMRQLAQVELSLVGQLPIKPKGPK
ncbi:MAG: type VI secretion system protein TssA [Acidobacteria bacterium]|nr:type VI secretion system protein TssA [Acidobacteriota bacterium]MCB9398977.1 type VI secretion system protein TssA [Acidobacteriota bacterium]